MKDKEIINAQLAEAFGQYAASEQNKSNVDLVRRIALLYEQKGELQSALEWSNYAASLTNNTDPALTRKASEIELKILDQSIAEFESWLNDYDKAESAPEVRRQLEDMKRQRSVISQIKTTPWEMGGTNDPLTGPDNQCRLQFG